MTRTTAQALVLAIVTAAATAGGVYLWRMGDAARGASESRTTGRALVGGPFTLVDHTGTTRTNKDLLGKFAIVSFGFTHCPDICPTTVQTVSEALEALGPAAGRIQPVFITIDPERDTVERMKEYHEGFDRRFWMLTGSVAAIAKTAKAYKVGYRKMKATADGSYQVNHTALIYLMGPEGQYMTHFPYSITPNKMAQQLRKWMGGGS
ncbi:MAG: SCO family protein [Rhodospirillaceae bacterium]|nr:SCO family protein [Rhodospirillaceae bacterium]MCY4309980.1 SCO family protein [Rhodospirillaceae bacterium]